MAKLTALVVAVLFVIASLNDELWVKITFFTFSLLAGVLIDVFIKEIRSQKTPQQKETKTPDILQ
jgi:hypothetical protein